MNSDARLLFHRLADLSPLERQRTLEELDVSAELRAEVESLLTFDSDQEIDLAASVGRAAREALGSEAARELSQCGPYRLKQLIGVGGMGTVYLAERMDGEVQQKVAVKLLRADEQRAGRHERFLKERQFLASLKHPSIVHLINAGKTAAGRPYLVMEYVEGTPIDLYAEKIDLRNKLVLFLRVCQAVSHAHQHLIIHRDLKPSNILVDSAGQPKLLDFGIAKLLEETGDQNQTVEQLLSPGYASPEQLSGGMQTTATDIYSLGAILYQLCTGKLPHESTPAPEVAAGKAEIIPARRLNPKIPEDLDYILRKAMRHEPAERFPSVEALTADIAALLDSKPIQARSGDAWYRSHKFLRRYWIPVGAALLVVASLSTGLYAANRQRRIAERRFVQLHEVSKKFLDLDLEISEADPKLRIKLISLSIQYLEGLGKEGMGKDSLADRALALEISNAYLSIARVQGVPEWNQLGQYQQAQQSLIKADAFAASVLRDEPDNREALWLTANVAHDRLVAAYAQRDYEQLRDYPQHFIDTFRHVARLGNMTRREINGATYMYGDMAEVYLGLHRFEEAARLARLGIEISQDTSTVPGPRAQAFNMLAGALMYLGDAQGAADAIEEARKQVEILRRVDHYPGYIAMILSQTGCREGLILGEDGSVNLNRPFEAIAPLEEAYQALEPFALRDPNNFEARLAVATAGRYLGDVLRHKDPKRALAVYDHSLARVREIPNDVAARRLEALLLAGSSYAARSTHRENDARDRIDAAFRLLRETKDYPSQTVIAGSEADATLRALAEHDAETGQPEKALATLDELYRAIMATHPNVESDLVNSVSLSQLAASRIQLLRRLGRAGEASSVESGRLELWRPWIRKLPGNPMIRRQLETAALSTTGS